ncbi:DHA2 family efflux MFS transporter permease subunit [Actinacidiphila bryophytorum]|uniref:Drug resistance transporter, EmrB/QacA subfamily n=1 Tax=Actinacidiphila bryophytorum TaxID=1436133 RepID=A0A9W4H1G4_9ACTN|nr:DHA2 family efflux MFS transporter permease subunit [Actinacidiphila bryophytorum]MBM9434987.1 DHA2 family efflux MFS transporter permease subunit [Actinacidiphila bryophytorum]MBN6544536.1 DHA2 family efflux MFS transporter permease subunit [Actinacidiphila bryophytorum]CAG7642139.1 Drug resistance transporter, EmrB/QacA subfamily [Actinacidiphila bryophytorum]
MPGRRLDQRLVVPVMFVATFFLVVMDGSITTVALPSIARSFGVSAAGSDSVVVVYPVCVGISIPVSGWLGDRFGAKPVLLTAMGLFTAASALCGTAGSLGQLVVCRGLQGLAGGLLTPVAGAMLFRTFTPAERVRASRIMTLPQQIAPSIAPMLGGTLVDGLSWRWVFYVNLPFGVAALLFGLFFLDNPRHGEPGRFDIPGLLLSGAAMSLLMYGVCEGARQGWSSPVITGSLAAGAALVAATVLVELRTAAPILRLRLFRDALFRDTKIVVLLGFVPFMGAMYAAPLFIQEAQGGSAFASGSSTFTEAVGVLLTVQLVARVYDRVGPRRIMAAGLFCVAVVLAVMTTVEAGTGPWAFRIYMFLLGLGMGAVFMPVTVASVSTIPKEDMGQASTLNSVISQFSMALAPALVATLLIADTPAGAHTAPPSAYRTVYLVLAVMALVAALFTLTIHDARTSRAPRTPQGPRAPGRRAPAARRKEHWSGP